MPHADEIRSVDNDELAPYLRATPVVDADHPAIIDFCAEHAGNCDDPVEQSVNLYYAVRDGLRYDPYSIDLTAHGLAASTTLASGRGWCVSKAVVLAACCRAMRIPARLGFADVQNHLSTARLREKMGSSVFIWHGYTELLLNDVWVKATPAFNIELCEKFRIKTLDFNGREDSIYHPYDLDGRQHMEYLNFRGEFADVPIAEMCEDFNQTYPGLMETIAEGNFDREIAQDATNG